MEMQFVCLMLGSTPIKSANSVIRFPKEYDLSRVTAELEYLHTVGMFVFNFFQFCDESGNLVCDQTGYFVSPPEFMDDAVWSTRTRVIAQRVNDLNAELLTA